MRPSLHRLSLERVLIDALRRGGWRVVSHPRIAGEAPDFIIRKANRQYVVELKSSSEPRRDRLIPFLAQAILEAKAAASKVGMADSAAPLAIVGAPRLSEQLIRDLRSFAAEVAPDVAIGIIDLAGSRVFVGPDIEALSSVVARVRRPARPLVLRPSGYLFSDLNQWMLKVLLAPQIPESFLRAPREPIRNVSHLAKSSQVSLMSASRFVNLLRAEGFLDEDSDILRLANVEGLLNRWRAGSARLAQEVPMRWIIPSTSSQQFVDAVRTYRKKRPRVCLGLFAAADALGFGFVRGVVPHLYVERLDPPALESLGLIAGDPSKHADVLIRVPLARESIFRAAVARDGLPVSDILQVWLDVADHPARGSKQAQTIWRRVLVPLWKQTSA